MTPPILALRAAILTACLSDATLAALMGGSVRLYDEPPRNAAPVYGVFGDAAVRDWSTSTDRGHDQDMAIAVWAQPGSAASAIRVAGRLSDILDDAALTLDGHRLVRLSVVGLDCERDPDSDLARATLRLRCITEVAG